MENKKVFRKAVLSDFINETTSQTVQKSTSNKFEKCKKYRIQGEFGEKKFIKP